MPTGVPVATVALNGGRNAGILAAEIVASSNSRLQDKIVEFKKDLVRDVETKYKRIEKLGYKEYLSKYKK